MFKFKKRIPVTVIGGFLGAGKTTLVNHVIHERDYRFGVIVNEFGETGVDGSLIENMDDDGVAELANGCLCCVGRDDLVGAMMNLATRDEPPEYLLVELSGLADPVPVAQTVLDPYVKGLFELDGIIGVADARNLSRTLQETPEGALQLAYASRVVLNKIDLASEAQRKTALELIHTLSPLVKVLEAEQARAPTEALLNLRAFEPNWEPENHHHRHTQGVTSFTLRGEHLIDRMAFNNFVERFIIARPGQVLRAKGFASIEGFEKKVLFQAVRDVFNITLSDEASTGTSELVIIGRELDEDEYRAAFKALTRPREPFLSRAFRTRQ